jgi:phage gp29-like protein
MAKTNGQLKAAPINRMSGYAELVASAMELTKHSQYFDRAMRYLTDDPTASKLKALVRRIDGGDIAALCETQIELERKDAQFAGVVQTRRNAITALDWCIEPDPDHEDDAAAQEAADYCLERLSNIAAWPKAMEHLVQAVGPNVSGVEIVWDKGEVADFVNVPCTRWATHPITNVGLVIKTDEEVMGYPVELFPGKFIIFQPYCKGGFPFRATLTHASINPFLMGTLSRVDWLAFSELFGMPLRLGYFPEGAKDSDVTSLKNMLERMSTDTAGVFPEGTNVDFKQAVGTGETYREQLHYVDNKFAILWLGQTLTTDVVATGSYAAARVHNKVRSDLLASDLRAEAGCYREQLFRPMIRLKYPGRDIPIPIFKRETSVIRDIDTDRMRLEQLAFAAQQGLPVPRRWLYESLGIPRPTAEEAIVLQPSAKAMLSNSVADDEPPDVQPGDGSNDDES